MKMLVVVHLVKLFAGRQNSRDGGSRIRKTTGQTNGIDVEKTKLRKAIDLPRVPGTGTKIEGLTVVGILEGPDGLQVEPELFAKDELFGKADDFDKRLAELEADGWAQAED